MTWNGLCPYRDNPLPGGVVHEGRNFHLTVGTRDAVHVNCAEPTCNALIGTIEPEYIYRAPYPEEH